jgi:hypothetical protein
VLKRNLTFASILAAGLLPACGPTWSNYVVPSARTGTSPPRWEYFCDSARTVESATDKLNAAGAQGWELAGAAGTVFCFKRPLP